MHYFNGLATHQGHKLLTKNITMDLFCKICSCGSVTVHGDGRKNWSMSLKTFKKEFPDLKLELGKYDNCNYCVNHWGADLCACGSGEKYSKCKGGFSECGKPMQSIEELKALI